MAKLSHSWTSVVGPWHWTADTAGFGILHSRRRTRAPRELLMQPTDKSYKIFKFLYDLVLLQSAKLAGCPVLRHFQ